MTAISVPLPELHDPDSGRLDAQRLATYLGVPLSQLAAALGKKYTTVYKTPASPGVQAGLQPIERSLDILSHLLPDRGTVRAWLNSPHPEFDLRTSMELILCGRADI